MPEPQPPFLAFLHNGIAEGGFGTDDTLAALLPLLDQVGEAHANGVVAPLDGIENLLVAENQLGFDPAQLMAPTKNVSRVEALQRPKSKALDIVGESRRTSEAELGIVHEDLRIGTPGADVDRPVYLPGYICWELKCGHHDQLTDVFSLGMILASVACGLDLTVREDLELFVRHRPNLFTVHPQLNPIVAAMIVQMTELDRHRRVQSVEVVAQRLRHYREQSADSLIAFNQLKGYRESAPTERGNIILTHLRNRLFEISRRNRLIHFKPTLQTLNLTLASVPLMLDHRNIRPEQLFVWHGQIAGALSKGDSLPLGRYVRFEDAPYASGVLDQIIAAERRDRNEFGFAQLRLVITFLRWHNLKDTAEERIHSPLLLLPVELTRKKGVRDSYVLRSLSSEAEVNPALRHHLRQLYGLNLPEKVDLSVTTLDEFHAVLAERIRASEPAVVLTRQDRPQIELIHDRARQRLDQFRRRQRLSGRGRRKFSSFDYSYDRDRFRPLGIQLYLSRVKPAPVPFADALGKAPVSRQPQILPPEGTAGDSAEKGANLFTVSQPEDSGNRYQWDFDLCSQTIGNFHYRKMSLVQDYSALLEGAARSRGFEDIFSLAPRPMRGKAPDLPLTDRYPIIDCDPTQVAAVASARDGQSYIIQGPPGTGKSQTITNLIADFVARGKRVLFVCEKRAAIDVVFHRLQRQGLDELCCLIHDSQADKRDFIRNLKQTYEKFISQPIDEAIDPRRSQLVRLIEIEIGALRRWSDALETKVADCNLTTHALLRRLIQLHGSHAELDALALEQVPAYGLWSPHAEVVRALSAGLKRISGRAALAEHSFRHLTDGALAGLHPLAAITEAAERCEGLLARLIAAVDGVSERVPGGNLVEIEAVVAYAKLIEPVAAADALDLLDPRGSRTRKTAKVAKEWRTAEKALGEMRVRNNHWLDRLPAEETASALARAQALEGAPLAWLRPGFWKLRAVMKTRYDFSQHVIPPTWSQALAGLQAEYAAAADVNRTSLALADALGELELAAGVELLERPAGALEALDPAARQLHSYLLENSEATYLVEQLAALQPVIRQLRDCLKLVFGDYAGFSCAEMVAELRQLRADLVWLPDVLPILAEALGLPAGLRAALQRLPLSADQLEHSMARKSLAGIYRSLPALEETDGRMIAQRAERLQGHYREWISLNARWIHQRVRQEFTRKVQLANISAAHLTEDEKELKKLYGTGRRELEHEFSKTMRHRSIRDLADGETGTVLRDLKPVWLMSPLSVSDTLPLAQNAFDLVIFDEASQILVEEAVPAVFRAPQVIVVGDEMQLPPTNFFSASHSDEDPLVDGEQAESVTEDLDADSFLTQAARNLSSTMLGWHYRSRSESLISFSNHAFYEGRLLTIPDRRVPGTQLPEIVVHTPGEARARVDALLDGSVTFHYQPAATYEARVNAQEADYIAHLIRELLGRQTGLSLGVVAFSEAQQSEIEGALKRLAGEDPQFSAQLESEYERQAEGQFCGLIVKNLENVQGDERDIILLSVCYGHDRRGKMLMNFGPINQRGGEKRLNVIFSRARHHMAVVSSIRHSEITNEFNDGAKCLKNFLEYAAACSIGDRATVQRVLGSYGLGGPLPAAAVLVDSVTETIAAAVRAEGLHLDTAVGHSTFRLPIAVRQGPGQDYVLGLLVDDAGHYAQSDLLERYLLRPTVLRSFGWKILVVTVKDWYHDPAGVVRQVRRALEGLEPELAEAPFEDLPPSEEEAAPAAEDLPPKNPIAAAADPGMGAPTAAPRHFICTEDGASKFWEVSIVGTALTVRFGRMGNRGQSQTKAFQSPDGARREQERLVRSKVGKGYTEQPPPLD